MLQFPESYRIAGAKGESGQFKIPLLSQSLYPTKIGYYFVIASNGFGWEHVSVSLKKPDMREMGRCPHWEEMCYIKDLFWPDTDTVVQYHPKKSDYVSTHPYCLHLWRPEVFLPVPPAIMVGMPGDNVQKL